MLLLNGQIWGEERGAESPTPVPAVAVRDMSPDPDVHGESEGVAFLQVKYAVCRGGGVKAALTPLAGDGAERSGRKRK
jgi:hypothetical protein